MSDFAKVLAAWDKSVHDLGEVYSELLGLAGSSKVTQAERTVIHERVCLIAPALKFLKGEGT